jgi:hypothetical protein
MTCSFHHANLLFCSTHPGFSCSAATLFVLTCSLCLTEYIIASTAGMLDDLNCFMARFTLSGVSCQLPGETFMQRNVYEALSGVQDLNQPLLGFSAARFCALRAFLPMYSLNKKLVITWLKTLFWRLRKCFNDLGNTQVLGFLVT